MLLVFVSSTLLVSPLPSQSAPRTQRPAQKQTPDSQPPPRAQRLAQRQQPATPPTGQTLATAVRFYNLPHFILWPGLAIFITVLAFNLFGDGLRDALDPKTR